MTTLRDETTRTGARPVPASTGTAATRVLGGVTLLALGVLLYLAFVASPAAGPSQGFDAVRFMYVHVPSAWLAYLSFAVCALCSALYLWRRTRSRFWDLLAGASAEVGTLFIALTLVTGSIWGRITWGVYWTWDARLTTTAVLFVMFLGYLAVRRVALDVEVRSRRAAVVGIIAFLNVPIVHNSVQWWRTLHQEPTVLRTDLSPQIEGLMLYTLLFGVLTFTLLYAWLVVHRFRVAWLEDRLEAAGLGRAIAERRAEAGLDEDPAVEGVPAPAGPAPDPSGPAGRTTPEVTAP